MFRPTLIFALISVNVLACAQDQTIISSTMPVLPTGSHIGIQLAYEVLPENVHARAQSYWDDALERGMETSRFMIDWADLEPTRGEYDLFDLEENLDNFRDDDLFTFVTIGILDSEGLVVPEHFLDPNNPGQLRKGLKLNSPEFIADFAILLEKTIPIMSERGVFAVALSNEPQVYLAENDGSVDDFAEFLRAARNKIRSIDERIAVTVVNVARITNRPLSRDPLVTKMIRESDVAAFNYGPFVKDLGDLRMDDPARVTRDFAELIDAADGRQIIIQELHFPSGYRDGKSHMDSSVQKQKDFYEMAFNLIAENPAFRATFLAAMVDMSSELTSLFSGALYDEPGVPRQFADQFAEWFETQGVVWHEDGSAKPALDSFLNGIEMVR